MGLMIDTNVLIRAERTAIAVDKRPDFSLWTRYGAGYISAITVSELLIGVHRADNDARRAKRTAFAEAVLVVPFVV